MYKAIAVGFLILVSTSLSAQLTEGWESIPEFQMPNGGIIQLVSAGTDIFVVRNDDNDLGTFRARIFDTSSETWKVTPNLTGRIGGPHVSRTSGNRHGFGYTATWIGSSLVVRGLTTNTPSTGVYSPSTDTWTYPTNLSSTISVGKGAVSVWTGSRIFYYGGWPSGGTGGLYDPATDTWDTRPGLAAGPSMGAGTTAVWTGTQVIVWGPGPVSGTTGGVYDVASDTWLSKPSLTNNTLGPSFWEGTSAFWTGSKLLIWSDSSRAGIYDPATDSWGSIANLVGSGAPSSNADSTKVWTGNRLVVWSGTPADQTGAIFNPATDSWQAATSFNAGTGAPSGRIQAESVAIGGNLWTVGGFTTSTLPGPYDNKGGKYNPVTDTWESVSVWNAGFGTPNDMLFGKHAGVFTGSEWVFWGGEDGSQTLVNSGAVYTPSSDTWSLPTNLSAANGSPQPRKNFGSCWTGSELLVLGGEEQSGNHAGNGGLYNPSTDSWTIPTGLSSLPYEANTKYARAIWLGDRAFVLGKRSSWNRYRGGIYVPTTDTWLNLPRLSAGTNAPVGYSSLHWTGNYVVAWDSNPEKTKFYDPIEDRWFKMTAISQVDAPDINRPNSAFVGNKALIWGAGRRGATYDRNKDRFYYRAGISEEGPDLDYDWSFNWTGDTGNTLTQNRIIVWGGARSSSIYNSGYVYDDEADSWMQMANANGSVTARKEHSGVWTGDRLIVWGGSGGSTLNDGGLYDLASNQWVNATNLKNGIGAPAARRLHSAIWSGQEMIVWGGIGSTVFDNGGRYDPVTDTWNTATGINTGAPAARVRHTAVWTGSRMIVWGGTGSSAQLNSGGIYDPVSDQWVVSTNLNSGAGAPSARAYHGSKWIGDKLFVWGGSSGSGPLNTGGIYDPSTDTWLNLPNLNNGTSGPLGASFPTVLWDGSHIMVFGSDTNGDPTGGYYDPSTDTWNIPTGLISTATVPTLYSDAAVTGGNGYLFHWSGSMASQEGQILDVEQDKWLNNTNLNSGTGSPAGTTDGICHWTGQHFVVWSNAFNTGGAYNPDTDTWENTPNLTNGVSDPPIFSGPSSFTGPSSANGSGSEYMVHGEMEWGTLGGIYHIDTAPVLTGAEIAVKRKDAWHVLHNGVDSVLSPESASSFILSYDVLNLGILNLTITNATLTNVSGCTPSISLSPIGTILPHANAALFSISVLAAAGTYQFDVEIASNDASEPNFIFTVVGEGPPASPEIELEDLLSNNLGFGANIPLLPVLAGQTNQLSLTIRNIGGAALTVGQITFSSQQNCSLAVNVSPSSSVGPSSSTTFTLDILTAYAGTYSADISIPNNDSNEDPFQFSISGTTYGQATIELRRSGGPIVVNGGNDTLTGTGAGSSAAMTYEVHSIGTDDLLVTSIQILNQVNCISSVTAFPSSPLAGPTGLTSVGLSCTPTNTGAFAFDLKVDSSDPIAPSYIISITGSAGPGVAGIAVDRSSIPIANSATDNIGLTAPAAQRLLTYTITNTGLADLVLGAISISNLVNCNSIVLINPVSPVSSAATTSLQVAITPIASGAFSASVSVATNVSGSNPFAFDISGSATVNPNLDIEHGGTPVPPSGNVDLGNVNAGSSKSVVLQLINNGGSDLILSGQPIVNLVNCGMLIVDNALLTITTGNFDSYVVTITPAAVGPFSVELQFLSNDPIDSTYTVTLSGEVRDSGGGSSSEDDGGCSSSKSYSKHRLLFLIVLVSVLLLRRKGIFGEI